MVRFSASYILTAMCNNTYYNLEPNILTTELGEDYGWEMDRGIMGCIILISDSYPS